MSLCKSTSSLRIHTLRLTPGQELKSTLLKFCRKKEIKAAFVITCVGSLTKVKLRYAGVPKSEQLCQHFEILSLVGTLSGQKSDSPSQVTISSDGVEHVVEDDNGGDCHLHISLGDANGCMRGGHLLGDAIINTTAEVVLGEATDLAFHREHDDTTGFPELIIS